MFNNGFILFQNTQFTHITFFIFCNSYYSNLSPSCTEWKVLHRLSGSPCRTGGGTRLTIITCPLTFNSCLRTSLCVNVKLQWDFKTGKILCIFFTPVKYSQPGISIASETHTDCYLFYFFGLSLPLDQSLVWVDVLYREFMCMSLFTFRAFDFAHTLQYILCFSVK